MWAELVFQEHLAEGPNFLWQGTQTVPDVSLL